jgi:hypothetical protein
MKAYEISITSRKMWKFKIQISSNVKWTKWRKVGKFFLIAVRKFLWYIKLNLSGILDVTRMDVTLGAGEVGGGRI